MNLRYLPNNSITRQLEPVSLNLEQATSLIIERARQLVNQLIEGRGHDKPPFLPEEFARLQGIKKIVKANLGEVSAVLLKFSDGYVIKVNEKHHPVKQNFSCAHEIGHILLRELKIELDTENIGYRTFNPQARGIAISKARERLCEAAAAELLMPEAIFRKFLSNFGISVNSIEPLAHIFRTSIQATAFRIAEVSTEPCLILRWQLWPINKPKGFRLIRCVGPEKKSRAMPLHTFVKHPSTLYKAYENGSSVKSHKLFRRGTDVKRLPMESKGFGRGENRYVVSLAFPGR